MSHAQMRSYTANDDQLQTWGMLPRYVCRLDHVWDWRELWKDPGVLASIDGFICILTRLTEMEKLPLYDILLLYKWCSMFKSFIKKAAFLNTQSLISAY